MSVGFRKSLLGFNTNDVLDYIEKTHKEFGAKENSLNEKVEGLKTALSSALTEQEKLKILNQELQYQLDEFNAKYAEIERLSENIGKLYLVAQANAKSIMENSENNARITAEAVEHNLSTIDNAHLSLKELRQSIADTSNEFIGRVNGLLASLNTARQQIDDNTEAMSEAKTGFEQVYESCKL